MSKTAATVLAFVVLILFSIPMSAQFGGLLPSGNVYAGVSYGQLTDVINKQSYAVLNVSLDGTWQALETSIADMRRKLVSKYKVDF